MSLVLTQVSAAQAEARVELQAGELHAPRRRHETYPAEQAAPFAHYRRMVEVAINFELVVSV